MRRKTAYLLMSLVCIIIGVYFTFNMYGQLRLQEMSLSSDPMTFHTATLVFAIYNSMTGLAILGFWIFFLLFCSTKEGKK